MPISTAIKNALADGTGTYTKLVKVTALPSKGGTVVAYALHTRDVVFEGTTYEAAPFEASKMQQTSGVSVDNATVAHILADLFTRNQIKGGKWARARVAIYDVDLNQLTEGPAKAHYGRIGNVTTSGVEATSEFRGLMQLLNQEQGDRTSKRCRYQTYDGDCTLDEADFTDAGTVVTVHNNQRITVTVSRPNGYFKYGRVRFTSGLNDGLEMEVINNTGQMLSLWQPMPYEIEIGDGVDCIAGDDKTLLTCHSKFNNAINHGGEDQMPLQEDVYRFPE